MIKTTYSQGDHELSSLTTELLLDNLNPVFFETGTNTGYGVICAIKSGFKKIHSIDIEERYYEMAKKNFVENFEFSDISFSFYLGDSGVLLSDIIKNIDERITFWLDGHEFHNIPLLDELETIKQHKIKDHTLIIDDVRMFNTSSWDNIGLDNVINKIKEINSRYSITFVNSINGVEDILIAKIL